MKSFIIRNSQYIYATMLVFSVALCFNQLNWMLENKAKSDLAEKLYARPEKKQYTVIQSETFFQKEVIGSDWVNIDSFYRIYKWCNIVSDSEPKLIHDRIKKIMEWQKLNSLIEPNKIDTSVKIKEVKIKVSKSN